MFSSPKSELVITTYQTVCSTVRQACSLHPNQNWLLQLPLILCHVRSSSPLARKRNEKLHVKMVVFFVEHCKPAEDEKTVVNTRLTASVHGR